MSGRPTLLLPALAVVSFGLVVVPSGVMMWRRALEPLPTEGLRILRMVHGKILEDYVEAEDSEELMIRAVQGMVSSLDRYSRFVEAEKVDAFVADQIEGTYVGIGVLLFPDRTPITVQAPLLGGPAEAAGIRPGDRILAIDGADVSAVTAADALETAATKLRGSDGSAATLRIARGDAEPFALRVERGSVSQPKVKWAHLVDPDARLGYVYVAGFQRDVTKAFDAAVAQIEIEAGAPLRGLVLDLRHDTGGLLDEAISLANRFLPEGEIVSIKRRNDDTIERLVARPERCRHPELPLVLLIDEVTASASEVVTGALQDHGRARVVGTRSYGKGVVQSIFQWSGHPFRLELTTAHYYTPNGRSIEGRMRRKEDGDAKGGIEPDRSVTLDKEQQRRVVAQLRSEEVPPPYRAAAREAAAAIGASIREPLRTDEDPQLAAAVAELADLARAAEEGR